MSFGRAFSNTLIIYFLVSFHLLDISCPVNGMYSRNDFPVLTTTSPPESESVVKKRLVFDEPSATSQRLERLSKICGAKEDCYYHFMFGCLCYGYTPETEPPPVQIPASVLASSAHMRAMGLVSLSTSDNGRPRSHSSCVAFCHGRDPCLCPFK